MAWVHGSDPTGFQIREGRILCEAMYAINERQYCCNLAPTAWTDAGAWPAVNALAGEDVTVARKGTLIVEMRVAIEAILTSFVANDVRFFPAAEYNWLNYYTKATLLTAAFGAVDWCVLTGKNINDVQPITEILKAVELLTHVGYFNHFAGLTYQKEAFKRWQGPPDMDTPALARAQCDAQAPGAWAAIGGAEFAERIDATGLGAYDDYVVQEAVDRVDVYIPASAAISVSRAWLSSHASNDTTGIMDIYEITAGIFAAPGWGAEGNLRHTLAAMPATGLTWWAEVLDDGSFLSTGANTYYLKTIEDAATPFVDDDTNQFCSFNMFGLHFDLTFLYN